MGPLRFTVLPFGLTPAPTIFQAIIEEILHDDILLDIARVYIDDIIVVADTRGECVRRTTAVLKKLLDAQLLISIEKLHFAQQEIKFLGHIVRHQQVQADPERCSAICEAPYPAMRKEVRRWVGMAAYLRTFIPKFGRIAAPLTAQAPKRGALPRDGELLDAFAKLKHALAKTVTLYAPRDGRPFRLYVDASLIAVGVALFQMWEEREMPIGFYSQKLSSVQQRWAATDREVYAIHCALKCTTSIVMGAPIVVFTDHAALTHLDTTATPKLVRYGLAIRAFGAEIRHISGKDNTVAGFLSRIDGQEVDEEISQHYVLLTLDDIVRDTPESMAAATRVEGPNAEIEERDGVSLKSSSRKAYVPAANREQIMYMAHAFAGGHVGVGKIIQLLTRGL